MLEDSSAALPSYHAAIISFQFASLPSQTLNIKVFLFRKVESYVSHNTILWLSTLFLLTQNLLTWAALSCGNCSMLLTLALEHLTVLIISLIRPLTEFAIQLTRLHLEVPHIKDPSYYMAGTMVTWKMPPFKTNLPPCCYTILFSPLLFLFLYHCLTEQNAPHKISFVGIHGPSSQWKYLYSFPWPEAVVLPHLHHLSPSPLHLVFLMFFILNFFVFS